MKSILALFGWKYVKDSQGNFHYYKCQHIDSSRGVRYYTKFEMNKDLERHPYTLKMRHCIE
jgi:hypothetical protein